MNRFRTLLVAGAIAGSALIGGIGGALLTSGGSVILATNTAAKAPAAVASPAPGGTFVPNEDPIHEQGESAPREAQENAGQRPTVP